MNDTSRTVAFSKVETGQLFVLDGTVWVRAGVLTPGCSAIRVGSSPLKVFVDSCERVRVLKSAQAGPQLGG